MVIRHFLVSAAIDSHVLVFIFLRVFYFKEWTNYDKKERSKSNFVAQP